MDVDPGPAVVKPALQATQALPERYWPLRHAVVLVLVVPLVVVTHSGAVEPMGHTVHICAFWAPMSCVVQALGQARQAGLRLASSMAPEYVPLAHGSHEAPPCPGRQKSLLSQKL